MSDNRQIRTPIYFRDHGFDRETVNEDERTIDLSFSSETPVIRWIDGERAHEVLSHKPRHVRLDRLRDAGPLLLDHWPDDHVGVLRNVRVDDGRGMAGAYLSLAGKGPDTLTMAVEGVKTKTSVGYRVHRFKREDPSEDGGLPTYRAVDWEPLEVSLVSMPADTSVGVGRQMEPAQYARGLGVDEKTDTSVEGKPKMSDANDKIRDAAPHVEPKVPPQLTPPQDRHEFDINAERERIRHQELARVREIAALGKQHNAEELAGKYCQDGRSLDEFRGALLEELSKRPESGVIPVRRLSDIGMSTTEKTEWSMCRALLACADKDWSRAGLEREVSQAVGKQLGREAQGFFIPPDVPGWRDGSQRDLTIGSAVSGGNLKGTDHRGDLYVDALRERTIVAQLGAQFLTDLVGDVTIPAANAVTTTYWVAENSAPTEGAPTYRQITMAPKTVAAYVDMSRRTLLQTSPSIESLVRNDIVTGVAIAVDKVAINGGATNEPSGVLASTGIGSVALGTNGAAPTFVSVVNVMREVDVDNALMGALAFATTPHARAKMMQTPRQASGVEGNFIIPEGAPNDLIGYRVEVSNAVPSTLAKGTGSNLSALVFGNWNDLIIGQWSGVDVLVDPYSLSTAGALRITVFQDVDTAVRHVESFSAIQDMITT